MEVKIIVALLQILQSVVPRPRTGQTQDNQERSDHKLGTPHPANNTSTVKARKKNIEVIREH